MWRGMLTKIGMTRKQQQHWNFPLDRTAAYKSGNPGTCLMTCSQARREFSSSSFCWSLVLSGSLAHMSPFNNSFVYIILEKGSLRRSDPFQGLLWSCFLPESYQAVITLELLVSFLEEWNVSPPFLPEPERCWFLGSVTQSVMLKPSISAWVQTDNPWSWQLAWSR